MVISVKKTILYLLIVVFTLFAQSTTVKDPDPERFSKAIEIFKNWDVKNSFPKQPVLFAGSSSIRLWKTQQDFPKLKVINRGFGGAHISDILHYIDETVLKYQPQVIVFYCGDNDVAADKNAEKVLGDFQLFCEKVSNVLPSTKIIYLPIKPSILRWSFWPEMQKTNELIESYIDNNNNFYHCDIVSPMLDDKGMPLKELFIEDNLHLSNEGYAVWKKQLKPLLETLIK